MQIQPAVVEELKNEMLVSAAEYQHRMSEIEQTKRERVLIVSRLALFRKLLALEGEQVEDAPGTLGTANRL